MARAPARIWVTRARPGAEATADRLRALGHEPIVAPLLEVRPLPGPEVDMKGVGSLAFSSANGVSAFAAREARRDLVAYTVGAATGEAARAAGFSDVRAGNADVVALTDLIAGDRRRPAGAVLHIGPDEPSGDLVGALAAAGVEARAVALYATAVADRAPDEIAEVALDAVLVHSPKAARALAALARPALRAVPALVLSENCAAPLRAAGFACVRVAASPHEEALLSLLRG